VGDPTDLPDLPDLLLACISAADTAISIADATAPDMPLVYVNPAFERLTGHPAALAIGRNARFMQGPGTDPGAVRALAEGLRAERPTRARLLNYRADGSAFWVDLHISPVRSRTGRVTHLVAVQHDVTAEVLSHQRAEHAATRDPLTGLMNRSTFITELERELARARRNGRSVGVLFLDIDDLKAVNDTYGHLVGDGFIVHVADSLRQRLRGQDAAARVGGDEFLALLADLPGDGVGPAEHVVADLERALTRSFSVDGTEYRTLVSIGIALYPRDGGTVRELITRADAAMYENKRPRGGRGGWTLTP